MDTKLNHLFYYYQNLLPTQCGVKVGQPNILEAMNILRQSFQNFPQVQIKSTHTMTNPLPEIFFQNQINSLQYNQGYQGHNLLGQKREFTNSTVPSEISQTNNTNFTSNNIFWGRNSEKDFKEDEAAKNNSQMDNSMMYQTNYINNNNKIFLPSQSHDVYNHFYNFNRTYYNDNFNNNINSINIGNNSNNESKLNRNSEDDPENCIEKKEYLLKNTKEANISNQQSSDSKGRITKPIKRNTNCPHLNARHYAKNMCNNCYHSKGRDKLAWKCPHKTKAHYALGICQNCYQANYNKIRKPNSSDKSED